MRVIEAYQFYSVYTKSSLLWKGGMLLTEVFQCLDHPGLSKWGKERKPEHLQNENVRAVLVTQGQDWFRNKSSTVCEKMEGEGEREKKSE